MVTPARIWQQGMTYHITTRGNRKEKIFREKSDYEVYLMFLKDAIEYYKHLNYELICFCLMSNHVHLMLKCNEGEPEHFMRRINSKYTRYFNIKYEYVGHLFQGRYFAEPITNINHLIEATKYIHLNPVKAKIVNDPNDYIWSSMKYYIKSKNNIDSENNRTNNGKTLMDMKNIKRKIENISINSYDVKIEEVMQYFKDRSYGEYIKIAPGERE